MVAKAIKRFFQFFINLFKKKEEEPLPISDTLAESVRKQGELIQKLVEMIEANKPEEEVESVFSGIEYGVTKKMVMKKFDGHKSENEYLEFSTTIYVADDGFRKVLPPWMLSDSNGVREEYPSDPVVKGVLAIKLYKYIIPGYYKPEDFELEPGENQLVKFFGKSHKQLQEYMREHNYNKKVNEAYSLNFYEL
jgi:hypothetical protein